MSLFQDLLFFQDSKTKFKAFSLYVVFLILALKMSSTINFIFKISKKNRLFKGKLYSGVVIFFNLFFFYLKSNKNCLN